MRFLIPKQKTHELDWICQTEGTGTLEAFEGGVGTGEALRPTAESHWESNANIMMSSWCGKHLSNWDGFCRTCDLKEMSLESKTKAISLNLTKNHWKKMTLHQQRFKGGLVGTEEESSVKLWKDSGFISKNLGLPVLWARFVCWNFLKNGCLLQKKTSFFDWYTVRWGRTVCYSLTTMEWSKRANLNPFL